jgi:hypothetical protein
MASTMSKSTASSIDEEMPDNEVERVALSPPKLVAMRCGLSLMYVVSYRIHHASVMSILGPSLSTCIFGSTVRVSGAAAISAYTQSQSHSQL